MARYSLQDWPGINEMQAAGTWRAPRFAVLRVRDPIISAVRHVRGGLARV